MLSEVPKDWRAMPFSEAVAINPKRHLSRDGLVPFLDMASLPFNGADVSVLKAREVVSGGSKFQSNDTLFARITPCAENGKLGFVKSVDGGEVAQGSTEFIVMASRSGLTLPEYVRYLAGWSEVRNKAIGLMEGTSGRQRVPNWAFNEIEVLIPSLNEQRRIAEVLRGVDEAIATHRESLIQMSRVRAATLHATFEESTWEVEKLGDLGRWSSGGTPSKADESLWNGDVPWICPRDMKSPVVARAGKSVSNKAIAGACKMVPKGTLLLVVRGMILAKAIPIATIAMPATYNQDIKAFHPNGRVTPKFVQLSLQHQEHSLLKQVNTATHGTKKLDSQTIADVDIPLPSLSMQIAISEAITDIDLAMVRAGEHHIRLNLLKNALQFDLLYGQVRVPA